MTARCKSANRFPRDAFARVAAANVVCERPSGHEGNHEAVRGATAFSWACKHEEKCCAEHGVHVTPHRGCILR